MLYLSQVLQLTCVDTELDAVYLKGSMVCAASYVNDPRNIHREANVFWHEQDLTDLSDDLSSEIRSSTWSMELRRMFQVGLYAASDLTASVAQPRELFVDYGDKFWSGDAVEKKRVRKFVDDEVAFVQLLLCPFVLCILSPSTD